MTEKVEPKEEAASKRAADATTVGVQSTEDKETESKIEEKGESKNAEVRKEHAADDRNKDTAEEIKSLQSEPEPEQAEPKEHRCAEHT